MHRRSTPLLIAVALVAAHSASAAPLTDPAWTWVWEASTSSSTGGTIEAPPGTPQTSWTPAFGTLGEVNNGSTSTFDSTAENAAIQTPSASILIDLDDATGYTIEWRARLVSATSTVDIGVDEGAFNAASLTWADSSDNFYILGLGIDGGGQNYVRLLGENNIFLAVHAAVTPGLHNIRVTVQNGLATLYVDDTTPIGSTAPRLNIPSTIQLGDGTGAGSGVFEVDYLRISDQVAFVPEPGSMALLGLGAIVVLGRKRR